MGYATSALYGDAANPSGIPADMLNTNADGSTDWGAVLANGIRGAADGAIRASVEEKFKSGQLVAMRNQQQSDKTMKMLVVAAIVYFLAVH